MSPQSQSYNIPHIPIEKLKAEREAIVLLSNPPLIKYYM